MSDPGRLDLTGSLAYLSLGSNIGEREASVLSAVRAMEMENIVRVFRISSLYETEPVASVPMNDFVNAVVEVQPLLCPEDLLKRLQTLERRMGRRGGHNMPRTLDIDIVTVGGRVLQSKHLRIPHPSYDSRLFVLLPLQEIAPDFACPASGRSVAEMIGALPEQRRVTRISGRRVVGR